MKGCRLEQGGLLAVLVLVRVLQEEIDEISHHAQPEYQDEKGQLASPAAE